MRGDPEDIGGSGIPGTEGENCGALLYGGPKRTELFRAIVIVPKRHRQTRQFSRGRRSNGYFTSFKSIWHHIITLQTYLTPYPSPPTPSNFRATPSGLQKRVAFFLRRAYCAEGGAEEDG